MSQPRPVGQEDLPPFDPRVPSPARIWNYWLGGQDNFPADREAGQRVLEILPSMAAIAQFARLFLADAVTQLAAGHGVRQFPAGRHRGAHRLRGLLTRSCCLTPVPC